MSTVEKFINDMKKLGWVDLHEQHNEVAECMFMQKEIENNGLICSICWDVSLAVLVMIRDGAIDSIPAETLLESIPSGYSYEFNTNTKKGCLVVWLD